jgi:1-phosphatidylinositol phosphodiesterase
MSAIDNSTSLAQMSIPGTHESSALFGATSKCQNFGVLRQLVRGIRFLDTRCRYKDASDPLYIHHANVYQNATFADVQNEVIEFLARNSNETVVMNIQQEYSSVDSATFRGKLSAEMNSNYWTFPTSVPTLGSVRNKIVLIRTCRRNLTDPNRPMIAGWDWPGNGLEWNGFAVSGLSWNYFFVTQNFWHGEGGEADGPGGMGDGPGGVGGVTGTYKGDQVEFYIGEAAKGRNPIKIYLNFLSRADTNIGVAAADINMRISGFIENNYSGTARLGVLPIDFCGNTGSGPGCLEDKIIGRNTFTTGTSYTYPTPEQPPALFKIQLSANGQPHGWMAEGSQGWAVTNNTDPIVFERYTWNGADYFKVQNASRYLSVSDEGQVGLYGWNDARTFQKESTWLFSDENGQPLRVLSGGRAGELWCTYGGDLLDVTYVPA